MIKTELSDTIKDQLITFKDKKITNDFPIYRRNLINSLVNTSSAHSDKDNKRLSITEISDKPKTGRVLCINSMHFKRAIDKSASIKHYQSMKDSEPRDGTIKLDRQMKLALRKEIIKNYRKPFNPPPKLTAKSYIIY